ncbi:MAG: hemerythrin domain-containing protein [Bdellovibrionales bacterium]|nr:hemerythrin domain-containing protein [Bdellovibrionales bacterium]
MDLNAAEQKRIEAEWSAASLATLIDDILEEHHEPTKKKLAELKNFVGEAVKESTSTCDSLTSLDSAIRGLMMTIKMHAEKEENVLFPMIKRLEAGDSRADEFCGGIENPLRVMEKDHREIDLHFERLHRWAEQHRSDRTVEKVRVIFLKLLHQLEADLKIHMYKEDAILFPRVKALG